MSVKHWQGLEVTWDKRARTAADWLQGETAVADIGCGLMSLEAFLPRTTRYIPMDLVARDSRTLVVDLNVGQIPPVASNTAVLLGVLEYIDDLPAVISQLRRFGKVIVSYNHVSVNDVLWKTGLRTKRVSWRNRLGRADFRRLLRSQGMEIVRKRRLRLGEALYEVKPNAVAT